MPEQRQLFIASPRGFCAGVERAITVVDLLLKKQGPPLYVRKEIVHNKVVVEDFMARGVVFVDELDQVPQDQTVVFSAHGISPAVRDEAKRRGLQAIDATCPLVTKVHQEIIQHVNDGFQLILIGHAGHDEVLGTMGEAPGKITLVTGTADVAALDFPQGAKLAYATQTTLSIDETRAIVAALKERYPDLHEPRKSDICYATQNRQDAVKSLVKAGIGFLLVVGSQTSSNSRRLCEVAENQGVQALLIDSAGDIEGEKVVGVPIIGLTAGASAPEHLVREVVDKLRGEGWQPREIVTLTENVRFSLPSELVG